MRISLVFAICALGACSLYVGDPPEHTFTVDLFGLNPAPVATGGSLCPAGLPPYLTEAGADALLGGDRPFLEWLAVYRDLYVELCG